MFFASRWCAGRAGPAFHIAMVDLAAQSQGY
jgi:hypothetical protein